MNVKYHFAEASLVTGKLQASLDLVHCCRPLLFLLLKLLILDCLCVLWALSQGLDHLELRWFSHQSFRPTWKLDVHLDDVHRVLEAQHV